MDTLGCHQCSHFELLVSFSILNVAYQFAQVQVKPASPSREADYPSVTDL